MAVIFSAASTATAVDNVAVAESAAWIIPAGTDRLVLGFLGQFSNPTATAQALKWGGVGGAALTRVGTQLAVVLADDVLGAFQLVAPSAQSATAYADWVTATAGTVLGMVAYTGVDQVAPVGAMVSAAAQLTGATATATVNVPTAVGDLVVACTFGFDTANNLITLTAAGGATERYNAPGLNYHYQRIRMCVTDFVATGTTTAMSTTMATSANTGYWGMVAFVVKASVLTSFAGTTILTNVRVRALPAAGVFGVVYRITGQMVDPSTGLPRANLTGINAAFFDESTPSALTAPKQVITNLSTNASGAFSWLLPGSALVAGQIGTFVSYHAALGYLGAYRIPLVA